MKISPRFSAAALAASLLLTACGGSGSGSATAEQNASAEANAAEAAPPVELPPMMTASQTYRCKDNSLVYVDFFNNTTAQFRAEKTGPATVLTATEPGKPFEAEGYSVSGSGPDVTIVRPGKSAQSCKA
jgi:hypothetical protein